MMPVIAAKSKKQASREQDKPEQRTVVQVRIPGVAWAAWIILMVISALVGIGLGTSGVPSLTLGLVVTALNLLGLWVLFALKVADQWEKGVMLRLGRFTGLRGPGLFWIFPVVDRVSSWIDHRVTVTSFSAEKTLTKDTVPVDVDAVLFWLVWDAEKAALEVENYRVAIAWAAQTALREVIGQMNLADILVGRGRMDRDLQKIIDERTTPWGVTVQ
ncbi:MAG TPA: SPFH domain-containing protein, partial [Anaerolineales bacterium]|nr:SPFH domain-containing protein [Anaerolineales bacterium]